MTPVVSLAIMTFRKGCELFKDVMRLPRFCAGLPGGVFVPGKRDVHSL